MAENVERNRELQMYKDLGLQAPKPLDLEYSLNHTYKLTSGTFNS